MYKNGLCSIICNSPKLEASQVSTDRRMVHQLWSIHTKEHKKIVKMNELQSYKITWLRFKSIIEFKKSKAIPKKIHIV